ncbi:MAG TPA: ASKHA domain-containing protein [Acidobacteriota bacterium]|nr:ASKHA domain-containing protein [Acidobacteriota bacterium]
MKEPTKLVRVDLQPIGKTIEVPCGASLQDVLCAHGVEFPCGGNGRCRGCRVRVLSGSLAAVTGGEEILSDREISEGWRLACRSVATGAVTLEIYQWETPILVDNSAFDFTPQEGMGIAVDLGTTTIVVQLLDLWTGHVLGVATDLNPQVSCGSDVMSRVQFAATGEGRCLLLNAVRKDVGRMIEDLLRANPHGERRVRRVSIVGNTVMHHLFCGIDVDPLAHYPFEPEDEGLRVFRPAELGWSIEGDPDVRFLPCLGGFVGSDILAGILATRMGESNALVALIDLGTNGEVVLGRRERLLCASTAAGPAFEGARISMGMRAATGAISEVRVSGDQLLCHVLGNVPPRGICGSGLVDAVAAGLNLDIINPSGRLSSGAGEWVLSPPVSLSQNDVRELQLAKGAIAAALHILLSQWGAKSADVTKVYLAGAFGNYINRSSARRIGLIDFPDEKVQPAGNTALLGAKLSLFTNREDAGYGSLRRQIEHVSLASDAHFEDVFVECMSFPP